MQAKRVHRIFSGNKTCSLKDLAISENPDGKSSERDFRSENGSISETIKIETPDLFRSRVRLFFFLVEDRRVELLTPRMQI